MSELVQPWIAFGLVLAALAALLYFAAWWEDNH